MSDGPLTQRERKLLGDAASLFAHRAHAEQEIAQTLKSALAAADAEHERAAAQLQSRVEQDRRDVSGERTRRLAEIESLAAAETAKAKRDLDTKRTTTKERADLDEAAAKKRLTEAAWMAETIHDSSIDKPGELFEAVKRDVQSRLEDLERAEKLARAYMRGIWQPERFLDAPATAPELVPPQPADVAALLRTEEEAAKDAAHRLVRLRGGKLFLGPLPMVYIVVAMIGAGVLVSWLGNWTWSDAGLYAVIGVGAVLTLAYAALYRSLRSRAKALSNNFVTSFARARALGKQAIDHAAGECRRQEAAIVDRRNKEVTRAKETFATTRAEVAAIHQQHLLTAEQKRTAKETEIARRRETDLAAAESNFSTRSTEIESRFNHEQREIEVRLQQTRAGAQHKHDHDWAALESNWKEGIASIREVTRDLHDQPASKAPAWTDPRWNEPKVGEVWSVPADCPAAVRVGSLSVDLAKFEGGLPTDPRLAVQGSHALELPVMLELPDRCSMLIQTGGGVRSAGASAADPEARAAGVALLQTVMLRLLTTFPPAKLRFTILDPLGLGQSFAGFMHLADFNPLLVNDRIWTEPRHIESRLTDLTEHMENVIQKYLRNQFSTIEEYNAHAGEVAEPYRFLVIADFPTNFTEIAAKRLASILSSGARCGVYTLIAADARQALPQGVTRADLERAAVRLSWRRDAAGAGRFVVDDPDLGKWPLTLEPPPTEAPFNAIVRMVGAQAKDAGRVQVPFHMIAPKEGAIWSKDSSKEVDVAVGRAGATKLQHMVLGRGTAQHALIAGRTGSGKSTLLHTIITNLAMWYSPDQVELFLIDFKKGVEFKTYATHEIPHARVIAIESEREFGLSVLRRLDAELKRRGERFRDSVVQDLASFRAANPKERMPRSLLLIDEFQELFVEDDKIAQECALLLDRLVRQGRAFGMHVVLGSQTLGGAYALARSTMGQMAVRIALQCSEADAFLIMSDDNSAPRLLTRPGEAIYNDANGALEGNSPFQVAWLPDEEREGFLDMVRDRSRANGRRSEPAIVFEGNVPADLSRNHLLAVALAKADKLQPVASPLAWLGEAIAIKDPTAAIFRRQSGANLLIVGQQDQTAMALMQASLLSLAAQTKPIASPPPTFFLFDGTPADSPFAGVLERTAAVSPHTVQNVPYRDVPEAMNTLAAILDERQASDRTDHPPLFLFVAGLQRFRMLRRAEDEFDFSATGADQVAKPDKQFARLLRDGPALGVHVVCWCDTLTSLTRTLDRQSQREFDQRVLMQMSAADSSALIDSPAASLIGQNRALFFSEEQGTIEKFRPYAQPSDAWVESIRAGFAGLSGSNR